MMDWVILISICSLTLSVRSQITLVGEDQLKIEAQDFLTMPRLLTTFYLKVECYNSGNSTGMCFNVDIAGVGSTSLATIIYSETSFRIIFKRTVKGFAVGFDTLGMKQYHPNEWVSFMVYAARFKDTYKVVALLNGKEMHTAKDYLLGNELLVSPSMRPGSQHRGAHVLLNGFVRNVFFFGPERVILQKDIQVNTNQNAVLNTEFVSRNTGDSFYEIFCIENFKKPWEYSNICKMANYHQIASSCTYFRGNEFIDFEVIWDKHNVPVGGRFKASANGTYQQMCEVNYKIRYPSSLGDPSTPQLIPMVYAHSGEGYDLIDVSSMLTKPLPKTEEHCPRKERYYFRPCRSNSSESKLQFILFDKDGKCNTDSKDVTVLIHHQSSYVTPTHITMMHLDCLKPTTSTITDSHVFIRFKDLPAHSKICLNVYYLGSPSMDISQLISISTETNYADIKKGVARRKTVRKLYNSHLLEFKGYYIRNVDHGCCLALDSSKRVTCSKDTSKCFPVKESSSRFELPQRGCLVLKRPVVSVEECLPPYDDKAQIMRWDKSDIIFSEEDQKEGMVAKVLSSSLNLGVTKAKRVSTFKRVIIHQKNPPEICYKKDVRPYGKVQRNTANITSWEQCSHHCKDTLTCEAWHWDIISTICTLLSNVGWRNAEIWRRGTLWKNSKGIFSGDRACVGNSRFFNSNISNFEGSTKAEIVAINAWSSSVYSNWVSRYGARFAWIGGSTNVYDFFSSQVNEKDPWLRIELNRIVTIKSVTIVNRKDGNGERLRDLEVKGGMNNDLSNPVIGYFQGPGTTGGVHMILLSRHTTLKFLSFQIKGTGTLSINGIRVEEGEKVADASVLVLNNKMYFCSYVPLNEKSGCYKHELDRIAVRRIPTPFVEILGGNKYSNVLYGKDSNGQIVHFRNNDETYTIVSVSNMKTTKVAKGFVAAKAYNRSQLLDTTKTGEFTVYDETYAISYYGIYREKKKSYLAVWLSEKDCELKVASTTHLALTSCKEILNYCSTVTTGVFTLKRKNGDKGMIWCEFKTKQEKKPIINSNPLMLPANENNRTYGHINLYGGFTVNFQLKLTKAVREDGMHEVISFYTETLNRTWEVTSSKDEIKYHNESTHWNTMLALGLLYKREPSKPSAWNKNRMRLAVRMATGKMEYIDSGLIRVQVNKWVNIQISTFQSRSSGNYTIDCYLDGLKIMEGKSMNASHEYWRDLVMGFKQYHHAVHGFIRNFDIRKEFQIGF